MKFTAVVTIKMKSKRLPNKNIKKLGNETLINRAIKTLNKVKNLEDIIIYCSDETIKEYIEPGLQYTFIKRDKRLDGDEIVFADIYDELSKIIDTDYFVVLNCTSPFIKSETIQDIMTHIGEYDSGFTATEHYTYLWYDGKPVNNARNMTIRTQDLKPFIVETTSFYVFSKKLFDKYHYRTGYNPYIKIVDMFEGCDIDTQEDWEFAKMIYKYKYE